MKVWIFFPLQLKTLTTQLLYLGLSVVRIKTKVLFYHFCHYIDGVRYYFTDTDYYDYDCTKDGVTFEDLEEVPSEDCNTCFCDFGEVVCTEG